jgi:hypothetical protein
MLPPSTPPAPPMASITPQSPLRSTGGILLPAAAVPRTLLALRLARRLLDPAPAAKAPARTLVRWRQLRYLYSLYPAAAYISRRHMSMRGTLKLSRDTMTCAQHHDSISTVSLAGKQATQYPQCVIGNTIGTKGARGWWGTQTTHCRYLWANTALILCHTCVSSFLLWYSPALKSSNMTQQRPA